MLTSKQRAHLRSLAHHLKPVLMIGKEGIGDSTASAVEDAFRTRELIKVKVLETSARGVGEIATQIAERVPGVVVAGTIGRTAILYRPHPEKPEIRP
jgi:RNA-binding protein